MSINISLPKSEELKPRIVVIGVGGAGGNAVNNMIASGLDGVEFIVANTDAQALAMSRAERRVQMGTGITQGLGAGMRPEVGEQSAEDSLTEIMEHLEGAHMLFVAAGMGGGTGTGAAPVIAKAARERGILTVAIVTKPFSFEGKRRMDLADQGVDRLYDNVDTLITIPNQNLFRVATERTTMTDAFSMADEVLYSGVRGVTDLMVVPGLINLDFNDVRTVMDEMGKAMMGTGEATGDNRAVEAAEAAISNPLLEDVSLKGAKGVLINITGGEDLTIFEVEGAAELIRGQVDSNANIIVGAAKDESLEGIVRVSVVATGVDTELQEAEPPKPLTTIRPFAHSALKAANPVSDMIEDIEQSFDAEGVVAPEPAMAEPAAAEIAPAPVPAPAPAPAPVAKAYAPRIQPANPAPAPIAPKSAPIAEQAPQQPMRRPFMFGRKRRSPAIAQTPPAPAPAARAPKADLFDDAQQELEIPSFLRRQSH